MGQLVDGVWHDVWYDTKASGGAFVRKDAGFRNWVTGRMAARGQRARAGSRPKPGAITFTSPTPAHGRTAP
jgi:glutathionyl-hydroquinone reductase